MGIESDNRTYAYACFQSIGKFKLFADQGEEGVDAICYRTVSVYDIAFGSYC